MPPQVEQMGELANQRSFFSVILKCRQTLQESQNQSAYVLVALFCHWIPLTEPVVIRRQRGGKSSVYQCLSLISAGL